jgi:hypothetical protein
MGRSMVFVIALATACVGGADSDGSCDAFEACGGDPTGRWEVVSMCGMNFVENANATQFDAPECDGAIRHVGASVSGTYDLAGGSASVDMVMQVDLEIALTEECVAATHGVASASFSLFCGALEAEYIQTPGFAAAECNVMDGACECLVTSVEEPVTDSWTYTVSGNSPDDGSTLTPFCVRGDRLTMRDEAPDGRISIMTLRRAAP